MILRDQLSVISLLLYPLKSDRRGLKQGLLTVGICGVFGACRNKVTSCIYSLTA